MVHFIANSDGCFHSKENVTELKNYAHTRLSRMRNYESIVPISIQIGQLSLSIFHDEAAHTKKKSAPKKCQKF